jgi:hypothetical protein
MATSSNISEQVQLVQAAYPYFEGEDCNLCGCELELRAVRVDHIAWVGRASAILVCRCCGQKYCLPYPEYEPTENDAEAIQAYCDYIEVKHAH